MTLTPKPKRRPRYANALSIEIAAAVNGLYKFNSLEQAGRKLASIGHNFTVTREQEETKLPSLILWMREFEVTPEETEKGYVGNFGRLQIAEEEDVFTITAHKIERPLKFHPIRKRPATRTPNWGHPVLRSIQKCNHFATLEEAQAELEKLHLEYPETTIPAINKLYLMIFSRRDDPKNPLKKYVLEIINQQGGGFLINWSLNEYKPSPHKVMPDVKAPTASDKPGHFASMVKLKKRKK